MAIPILKTDKSGGFLLFSIGNGTVHHKMRVHVRPFLSAGTGTAPIPYDYAYAASQGNEETTIGQTALNWMLNLQPNWDSSWRITLSRVYQNSAPDAGNGTVAPVFPTPLLPAIVGNAGSSNNWLAGQVTFAFPCAGGGKAKIIFLSSQEWFPTGTARDVTPKLTGLNAEKMVAYLVGQGNAYLTSGIASVLSGQASIGGTNQSTRICGHDGSQFLPECHETVTFNRRVRRELHYT